MKTTRHCPDCPDVPLELIRVLDDDKGGPSVGFDATTAGFDPGWLSGNYKGLIGTIHGFLCPRCSRVLFYMLNAEQAEAYFAEARQRRQQAKTGGELSIAGERGGLALEDGSGSP